MKEELYMSRCLQLAKQGTGRVAPNPLVGAVLVENDEIIGEGYHAKFGEAHAEVNCINQAIRAGQESRISSSTMYVSLEPCAHFGKTPPCADLLIAHRIPKVVIGCRDPFPEVDGKGMEKLRSAGMDVTCGVLENECIAVNRRFFTFHQRHRPYIILKWAQTADGFIGSTNGEPGDPLRRRLRISNEYTDRLVHKWRSEEAAILVGTNTVVHDDPQLTTRLWPGPSPLRLIVDMHLRLPLFSKVFDGSVKTIVFNSLKHEESDRLSYYQVTEDVSLVHQVLNGLYQLNIQSVIVEGGARLLQAFIDEECWDEARVITNSELTAAGGLPAPRLKIASRQGEINLFADRIETFAPLGSPILK